MLEGSDDLDRDVRKIVQRVMKEHGRIIFNGDGYSAAWQEEAARRGLLNLSTTVDALPHYLDEKNVKLFAAHSIYTREEMEARCEAALEEYAKTLSIEAHTMSQMAHRRSFRRRGGTPPGWQRALPPGGWPARGSPGRERPGCWKSSPPC